MSNRPEIELTVQDRDENNNLTGDWRYVSDAEVVAYVRREVESGTIKGTERQWHGPISFHPKGRPELGDDLPAGSYLVIQVSDGGSET